jgi:glycosyltransferase involved in cell wall biosynthesis
MITGMSMATSQRARKEAVRSVLIFHNVLWPHYKAIVFNELFKQCAEQSIAMHVVHFAPSDRGQAELSTVDVGLHQYPFRVLSDRHFSDISGWEKIHLSFRALSESDAGVIVLPGYWDLSFWALLIAARLQRRAVVLTFDSTECDRPRHWPIELLKRIFVALCNGGFTYGVRSWRYLNRLGMPDGAIRTRCQATANEDIYKIYGASLAQRQEIIERYALGQHNFCFVGRLSAEKNVSTLIRAFGLLQRTDSRAAEWGLLIVGGGPERASLVDLSVKEGLRRASFVGGVSWRAVPEFLAASDVLVLPSLSEPWGLVVNEAMACGLPTIVSSRCGCVEDIVIPGKTGFLFDPLDPEELQERMQIFVNAPSLIPTFGAAAKQLISAFSPAVAASQMLLGLKKLLNN